ncbi:MAG: hypothetical protein KDD10_06210, partial [Phaeodactylibacter sp.]|nr:hypothetical protein [Phaeodactylibacter sp.]
MIQPGGAGCGGEQVVNIQIVPSQGNSPITSQELPDSLGGTGSPYYFFQPTGISDGLPWLIINAGEVPQEFQDMFHGTIRINFHSPQFTWHLGLNGNPPGAGSGLHDLHSVVWHEALHVLGFASTFFENPERSRFDRFLTLVYQDGTEVPVIENKNPPNFDWDISAAITNNNALFSSCLDPSSIEPDMILQGPIGDYPIFTGSQIAPGSSFSHLEINCDGNLTPEYLMAPALPQETRRPITGEEIKVMCALGYVMAQGGGPACGCRVAGAEDFGPTCDSLYRISLCEDSLIIRIADLIANDDPNVVDIGHVGMLAPLMGSVERVGNDLIFRPGRIGLAVFAYVPVGCNGQEGNTTKVFVNIVLQGSSILDPMEGTNFEGVITPLALSPGLNYYLSVETFASISAAPDDVFLQFGLIDGRNLAYSPAYNDSLVYSGPQFNITSFSASDANSSLRNAAHCFSISSDSLNTLWIYTNTSQGEASAVFSLYDIELIEDTFTAGPDTTLANCGGEARLGGRFCMLSDVAITYTWEVAGQVIGEYTVVNDSIAIITDNIDTSTYELVITPGTTAEYVLRRTISDFGGLPNDFALCAETDTVTVTVLQAPPSPGFTFVVNEDSCQVQFTSLDTTGTHLWDFGDSGSSSEASPLHTYSGSGPFSVVHTVSNECGAFEADQIVDISCCAAPDAAFAVSMDTCTRTVSFAAAPGQ